MSNIEYAGHTIDTSALPAVSVEALIRRGLSHYLGNEQASKLTAWKSRDENKGASDDQIAAQKASLIESALAALREGTIGVRAPRAPSIDPVEREMERLALAEVKETLKANGLKFPKDGETITFGSGESAVSLSGDELVERRIAKHGDRLHKEAEAEIKRKARAKAKLAETVKAGDAASELL